MVLRGQGVAVVFRNCIMFEWGESSSVERAYVCDCSDWEWGIEFSKWSVRSCGGESGRHGWVRLKFSLLQFTQEWGSCSRGSFIMRFKGWFWFGYKRINGNCTENIDDFCSCAAGGRHDRSVYWRGEESKMVPKADQNQLFYKAGPVRRGVPFRLSLHEGRLSCIGCYVGNDYGGFLSDSDFHLIERSGKGSYFRIFLPL